MIFGRTWVDSPDDRAVQLLAHPIGAISVRRPEEHERVKRLQTLVELPRDGITRLDLPLVSNHTSIPVRTMCAPMERADRRVGLVVAQKTTHLLRSPVALSTVPNFQFDGTV